MKVIVPAAGQGTRLYPQTHTKPKPMVRVAGKPILGHILDGVPEDDVDEVVVVVGVMQEMVVDYVAEAHGDRLDVSFVEQSETEGLGHSIYQAEPHVDGDSVCILLGDMIFENGYENYLEAHRAMDGVDGSIGVKVVEEPSNYGIVETDGNTITSMVEKPAEPKSDLAISGIYFVDRSDLLFDALDHLVSNDVRGAGNEYQLTDALERMLQQGAELGVFDVEDWYDCGRPATLLEANRVLTERKATSRGGVDSSSVIIEPVDIDENANVERSIVGPHVSIDEHVRVTDSRVQDSIIGVESTLENVNISRSLVGDRSTVTDDQNNLNIGDSSEVDL